MIVLLAVQFLFFNIAYVVGRIKKDYSILDVFWGPSFLVTFLVGFFYIGTDSIRVNLIGLLVGIWAIRLGAYILYRSRKLGKEDFRYASWRKDWGSKANIMFYFKVYLLQMVLSLAIGYPLFLVFTYSIGAADFPSIADVIGISMWVIGFLFEAIGDYQKNKFKNDKSNEGKVCDIGLWKYTRHPNYFGEALLWWGIVVLMISEIPIYYTLWGPLFLTFLLLKVSGVALLEEKHKENDKYADYKRRTSGFIPWPPK